MEKTYKRVPFTIELAKKIQSGEVEGRIVTDTNHNVRIICLDAISVLPVIVLIKLTSGEESLREFNITGYSIKTNSQLFIELQEELPKHKFKPFDKVLVKINLNGIWEPRLYSRRCTDGSYAHYCQDGKSYGEILPYEGNEHLVGTTDKPKEE